MTNVPPGPQPPQGPWVWHLQETYKALLPLSVEALKMLGLINGGAAVALLTYAGALVTHGGSAPHIKWAIFWYCAGLFVTVLTFIIAYCTQLVLYDEERKRHQGLQVRERHAIGVGFAIVLALFAAIAFGLGCWSAAQALIPG